MSEAQMFEALSELMYRNPQRNDGDAYELELAAWGLGLRPERPDPKDFNQFPSSRRKVVDFITGMKEIYHDG